MADFKEDPAVSAALAQLRHISMILLTGVVACVTWLVCRNHLDGRRAITLVGTKGSRNEKRPDLYQHRQRDPKQDGQPLKLRLCGAMSSSLD